MARKLVIFGNGLGMSLDPAHFSLTAALEDIWEREDFLTLEQQQLIERCLGRPGAPQGEDELDLLHQAVTHCKSLNLIGDGDIHWLTEDGQSFPEITATYIHKVATKLHNYNGTLPQAFEDALIDFIRETKSHVATLNYDKLLYNSFIDNDLVDGYNGSLIDGMLNRGFSADALERRYDNDFGYYLHLHGSPLFMEHEGSIVKLSRERLNLDRDIPSKHIVLTHVKHKLSVIAASHALSTYWDYLQFALSEAEEVILFGYSGFDTHLNMLLKPYLKSIPLRVVEWSGAGDQVERETFWARCLGRAVAVERLDNISDFVAWQ
ncbi:SIR2 family protein [Pseudoalteromonas sp. BZK2]|uniref:SIR2 family protein n=1 Tax=Pseudoalteromonas sp. BZK2 TaxID=1904458 RepID=UPI001654A529|nr:SIR2 family protein [Pseudoalteromonas sp. BZK2]MBC7010376.1 SIR2 family protein [Pseudoalteromonas sp. BZK2]